MICEPLAPVLGVVARAQKAFRAILVDGAAEGLSVETYVRYLSMQYHLTKGVQRAFLAVAAHPSLGDRPSLRRFLVDFAFEEEPHYAIAQRDLGHLGRSVLPCPIDVQLWWRYFDVEITERPFVRLGATCVLENLGPGIADLGKDLLARADFLTEASTHFLKIHFHEQLPHGDQVVAALAAVRLRPQEVDDLVDGARTGALLYLRMAQWALGTDEIARALWSEDEGRGRSPHVAADAVGASRN